MDVLEALDRLRGSLFMNEDEEVMEVIFKPGLSEPEILAFEEELGAAVPGDYRRLLEVCGGIEGLNVEIDFAGAAHQWGDEMFPLAIPFGADGFGNFWVVDCLSKREDEAWIFFHCHDAPVLLFHGRGMADFLLDLITLHRDEEKSQIHIVHDDLVFDVWGKNPGVVAQAEALLSSDSALREFAGELEEGYSIVDLRGVPSGMGFSWGRYGAKTLLRRFGEERIFAYAKPAGKVGLLRRLFGG